MCTLIVFLLNSAYLEVYDPKPDFKRYFHLQIQYISTYQKKNLSSGKNKIYNILKTEYGTSRGAVDKNRPVNAGDTGSIPSPGGFTCLWNLR